MNKNYQECVVNLTTHRKNWNAASNAEISAKRTSGIYLGTLLTDSVGKTAEIQNRLDSYGDQNTCTTKAFLEQSQHKYILGDRCLQFHSQIQTPIQTWNGATDVRWAKRTWCWSNKMPTRNLENPINILRLRPNEIVLEKASQHGGNTDKIPTLGQNHKLKLLGHIFWEPMKMTPFDKFFLNMDQMFPKHAMFGGVENQKMDWPIESVKDALHAPGRMVPIQANLLNIQIITCSKILLTKPTSNPRNFKEPQETLQRYKCDPSLTATQRAVAIVGLCSAIHELNAGALVHAHHPSTGSPYRHGIWGALKRWHGSHGELWKAVTQHRR